MAPVPERNYISHIPVGLMELEYVGFFFIELFSHLDPNRQSVVNWETWEQQIVSLQL